MQLMLKSWWARMSLWENFSNFASSKNFMAKKVTAVVKLQLAAGKATPG